MITWAYSLTVKESEHQGTTIAQQKSASQQAELNNQSIIQAQRILQLQQPTQPKGHINKIYSLEVFPILCDDAPTASGRSSYLLYFLIGPLLS